MARVNRPKGEQLCLLSERTTISEEVIWLNMHLCLLFENKEKLYSDRFKLGFNIVICPTAQV